MNLPSPSAWLNKQQPMTLIQLHAFLKTAGAFLLWNYSNDWFLAAFHIDPAASALLAISPASAYIFLYGMWENVNRGKSSQLKNFNIHVQWSLDCDDDLIFTGEVETTKEIVSPEEMAKYKLEKGVKRYHVHAKRDLPDKAAKTTFREIVLISNRNQDDLFNATDGGICIYNGMFYMAPAIKQTWVWLADYKNVNPDPESSEMLVNHRVMAEAWCHRDGEELQRGLGISPRSTVGTQTVIDAMKDMPLTGIKNAMDLNNERSINDTMSRGMQDAGMIADAKAGVVIEAEERIKKPANPLLKFINIKYAAYAAVLAAVVYLAQLYMKGGA